MGLEVSGSEIVSVGKLGTEGYILLFSSEIARYLDAYKFVVNNGHLELSQHRRRSYDTRSGGDIHRICAMHSFHQWF